MCVLQDFETLTPNLLARTIETVEGGGIVVLLLKTMTSLRQLFTMTMESHARFRTEGGHNSEVVGRFNERFLLSLGNCEECLVLDDELNILPISSHARGIKPFQRDEDTDLTPEQRELEDLKESLADTQPVGALVEVAKTVDQARAVLTFVEAISEKTLRSTVALTAGRGRGKSSALGVSIAAAIAHGYSNIFVTSPSPENLKTLFEFVFKAFDALKYTEHADYELVQSTNPDFNKAIVRVNVFRSHRQTIQYIAPHDWQKLGQAELVVIDEAAAIPLPLVKKLLGPYLVFLSSTVNGYEGTGRALSHKLIQQLREQGRDSADSGGAVSSGTSAAVSGRVFRDVTLDEPIRYGAGDKIESWLNGLLCLDANNHIPRIISSCPHPSECELFYVERDTLLSYHKASEEFLQRMVGLYVSSHYKNSPDDLQLLADAPAHHLFVLLGPVSKQQNTLPDILCVVQLCLEGEISKESVRNSLARGLKAAGDMIPWTMSTQFQEPEFASLSGARVVRIATHPELQRMGYGQRAIEQLASYYKGEITSMDEDSDSGGEGGSNGAPTPKTTEGGGLLQEKLRPRTGLPPLLTRLVDRRAESLSWLGVGFGLTHSLLRFWTRAGFSTVYLRQTTNDLTGEHSSIMLRPLQDRAQGWVASFNTDFRRRFGNLLGSCFRTFGCQLAQEILTPEFRADGTPGVASTQATLTAADVDAEYNAYDLRRLESYARNMVDHHVITDLLPTLGRHYFGRRVSLAGGVSAVQAAVLIGTGLQRKSMDEIASELSLPINQILALFNKLMRKFSQCLRGLKEAQVSAKLPKQTADQPRFKPLDAAGLGEELGAAAKESTSLLAKKQAEFLAGDLAEYAIKGGDEEWSAALESGKVKGNVSIKAAAGGKKRKRVKIHDRDRG